MKHFFVFFFTAINTLSAQPIIPTTEVLLFADPSTGLPSLLVSDTMMLQGHQLEKSLSVEFPKAFNKTNFNKHQVIIGDHLFFIDDGNGPIIFYNHNRFKHIGPNFRHRNQFGAASFTYNNKLYMWGGEGLFSSTNILTAFNFKTTQWEQIKTFNCKIQPRSHMVYTLNHDKLMIYNGLRNDSKFFNDKAAAIDNYVHILDLKTLIWTKGAKIKKDYSLINSDTSFQTYFSKDNSYYIIRDRQIYEYNLIENFIKLYRLNDQIDIENIIYSKKTDHVSYLFKDKNGKIKFISENIGAFLGEPLKTDTLFVSIKDWTKQALILAIGILSVTITVLFWRRLAKRKETAFIYISKTKQFKYLNNTLPEIEPLKKVILLKFFNSGNYVKLQDINNTIGQLEPHLGFDALNKKRENILDNLKTLLAVFLQMEKADIFKRRKNFSDKRIIEIKLNIPTKIV